MTDTALSVRRFGLPLTAQIFLIPAVFLVLGFVVRFAAFRAALPDTDPSAFITEMCRWDCGWYVGIVQRGYDAFPVPLMTLAANWAFFPLLPMLVAALVFVTKLPILWAAAIISVACAYGAALVAWQLLGKNMRAYILFSAFLLAGPFSMYFTTFFTEVLFVLLTLCVFLALKRQNYLWAGLFAALLSATRIVGVFIVFAIVVQAFLDFRERGGKARGFVGYVLGRPDLLLAIFIAPLGLFAYMGFLYWRIGDGLAFYHVQRAWGRETGSPFAYLWQGLSAFSPTGFWPSVPQQLALAGVWGIVMTLILAWRRQYAAAVFCVVCVFLPLAAGLASMVRFMSALSPLTLLAATGLASSRVLFGLSLVALVVGGYFCTIAWMQGVLSLV